MTKKIVLIIAVLVIALFGRLYNITQYPVSLTMDEVGIGYNAYSILKTGKDEWGISLPLVFKALGDYKPPVGVYFTSLSINFLGLNEFAERLPVALLGALTSIVFIFLLKEIGISDFGSVMGGVFMALNPWHIDFSRANFEAIIALFFSTLGVWLVLVWSKNNKPLVLSLGIASFALSVWSYHAERLFSPILFIILLYIFRNKFKTFIKKRNNLILPLITFLIFFIPFLYLYLFTPAINSRPLATSILRETSLMQQLHNGVYNDWKEAIFNNDLYLIFRHWAGKYLNYYDLRFWFWKGLGMTPPGYLDIGLFYLVDAPVIILGIFHLFTNKNKTLKSLAVSWFFIGPLSASITMNEQHPLRALTWLPFFGFAYALGAQTIWQKLKNVKKKIAIVSLYVSSLILCILYFINLYTVQYPRYYSEYWQYGYKQIALYACQNLDRYKEVIISDTFGSDAPINTGTPYAYVLFYCKYNPATYLANDRQITKFSFRRVDWKNDSKRVNTLLIGSFWDMPLDQIPAKQILQKIYFLNGKLGFVIAASYN
jgi:4-amino-4-deoxy-L-arabinose transferase-like glycosyltransferase